MKTNGLFCIVLILAVFAGRSSGAPPVEIAVIFSSHIDPYRQAYEGFSRSLQERGVVFRVAQYDLERDGAETIVRQVTGRRPSLIFTVGPEASALAKESIKNIPVVFAMVLHPETFAGPNSTGVSLEIPVRVKLDHIRRIFPDVRKVGIIYSRKASYAYRETVQACRETGIRPVVREIESGNEFPEAFRAMTGQIDIFLMVPDTRIYSPKSIEYLLAESMRNRLSVIGLSSSYTRAGALLSFETDYVDIGRRAGDAAARIVGGERPGNIAPSGPEKIKISFNIVVAERLRIKIPARTLSQAEEIFGK